MCVLEYIHPILLVNSDMQVDRIMPNIFPFDQIKILNKSGELKDLAKASDNLNLQALSKNCHKYIIRTITETSKAQIITDVNIGYSRF